MVRTAGIGSPPLGDSEATSAEQQLAKTFQSRFRRSETSFAAWRERCATWFRLYGNDAWSEEDKAAMEEEGRIAVTFNYALSTINVLVGGDQADRKEGRFLGIDGQLYDEKVGEWLTTIVRWIYRHGKGHRHESQAQHDQLVAGYGWVEVFMDDGRFPFRVKPQYVDCLSMYLDPDYKDDNASDARFVICAADVAREDAIARWPGRRAELEQLKAATGHRLFPKQPVRGRHYATPAPENASRTEEDERLTIYNYQFKKRVPWHAFTDPKTGEKKQLSAEEFEEWKKAAFTAVDPETGVSLVPEIKTIKFARECVFRAFLAAGGDGASGGDVVVLEEPKRIAEDMFTYRCATGFRRKDGATGQTKHFGLMAVIEQPQQLVAKVLSTLLDMLARNSKGGGFYKPDAILDEEKFKANGGKPGQWTAIADDAELGVDIVEREPMQWPSAMDRLLDILVTSIPELSAVTNWLKGTAQTERSNVLISNLQGQSMVALNPILDPMNQLRVELATLCAKLAQQYIAPEDLNKVIGEQEIEGLTHMPVEDPMNPGVEAINPRTLKKALQPIPYQDPETGEQRPITPADILRNTEILDFHVAVDLGAASSTAKQALWQVWNETGLLAKVIELMPALGDKLMPFMLRNTPGVPAETARELANDIEREIAQQRQMQSFQGIAQAVQGLQPDQQAQLEQMLQQLLAQQQPPAAAAPTAQPMQ